VAIPESFLVAWTPSSRSHFSIHVKTRQVNRKEMMRVFPFREEVMFYAKSAAVLAWKSPLLH